MITTQEIMNRSHHMYYMFSEMIVWMKFIYIYICTEGDRIVISYDRYQHKAL